MKKLITALVGITMLVAATSASALQAGGWRLNITESADGDTPISVMEIEYLYDDDDSALTTDLDAFEPDLGYTICGWDRVIASGAFAGTYQVGCDTFTGNRLGTPNTTIVIASDWRTSVKARRQVYTMLDNSFLTYWTTTAKVTATDSLALQYMIYTGGDATGRTLPDVTSYAITIPVDLVDTGAPIAWTFEYFDSAMGAWLQDHVKTSNDVNWSAAASVWKVSTDYYLKDDSNVYAWSGTEWGLALTGATATTANAAISDSGTRVAYRLEFAL